MSAINAAADRGPSPGRRADMAVVIALGDWTNSLVPLREVPLHAGPIVTIIVPRGGIAHFAMGALEALFAAMMSTSQHQRQTLVLGIFLDSLEAVNVCSHLVAQRHEIINVGPRSIFSILGDFLAGSA